MTPRVSLRSWLALALLVGGVVLQAASARAQGASQTIDLIHLEGLLDPANADYLSDRLAAAQEDGVHAAVVQFDSPGALDIELDELIDDVHGSTVPVIVWVAPRDARAPSAAVLIAYAADLFYMSDGTEAGPVTPVSLESEFAPSARTLDTLAFLARENERSIWTNLDEVMNAETAVSRGVADGFASTHAQLLEVVDGEEVRTGAGESVTLETWDEGPTVRYRFQDLTLLQRLLHFAVDPKIALFLITIGLWGIIFELYNPGIGLAGMTGAASLALGFYALYVLPTNWIALALVVLAMLFMLVDLQTAGFGVWTLTGVASLVAGGRMLFSGADQLQLGWWVVAGAVVGSLVFFVSVMTAALRVRLRRPVDDDEAIVGTVGEAVTDIAPEGTVQSNGTLWRGRTMETGIAAGSKVKIMATEGLVLLVEPLHDQPDAGAE
ncbi:MAG: NfeD family protein [Actinomycetota bacterium]